MTKKIHIVVLEESEVQELEAITRKGIASARTITRARVLLMANEKGLRKKDKEISDALGLAITTPQDIRRRYNKGGLQRALHDAARPGKPKTIPPATQSLVVATACTEPPKGASRWTLDLLEEHLQKKGHKIKRTAIYLTLRKNDLKPWRKKNVVYPKA